MQMLMAHIQIKTALAINFCDSNKIMGRDERQLIEISVWVVGDQSLLTLFDFRLIHSIWNKFDLNNLPRNLRLCFDENGLATNGNHTIKLNLDKKSGHGLMINVEHEPTLTNWQYPLNLTNDVQRDENVVTTNK